MSSQMGLSRKEKIWLSLPIGLLGILLIPLFIAATLNSIKHSDVAQKRAVFSPLVDLVLDAQAERTEDGRVVISGTTNLPDGLKLWVAVEEGHLPLGAPKEIAGDESVYVNDGKITTKPLWLAVPNNLFTKKGWPAGVEVDFRNRPFPARPYKVHFTSYFNGAWQTQDVLAVLGGGGGKNLKGTILKPTDPDVSDSDKVVDYYQTLTFPELSPETKAISIVRGAVMTLPDSGRSTGDVQAVVDLYMNSPGLKVAKGWGAKSTGASEFEVSFDFINGQLGEQQALWSADTKTGKVKYINSNAKEFSWAPSY